MGVDYDMWHSNMAAINMNDMLHAGSPTCSDHVECKGVPCLGHDRHMIDE